MRADGPGRGLRRRRVDSSVVRWSALHACCIITDWGHPDASGEPGCMRICVAKAGLGEVRLSRARAGPGPGRARVATTPTSQPARLTTTRSLQLRSRQSLNRHGRFVSECRRRCQDLLREWRWVVEQECCRLARGQAGQDEEAEGRTGRNWRRGRDQADPGTFRTKGASDWEERA